MSASHRLFHVLFPVSLATLLAIPGPSAVDGVHFMQKVDMVRDFIERIPRSFFAVKTNTMDILRCGSARGEVNRDLIRETDY